jgi:hypothetical protein
MSLRSLCCRNPDNNRLPGLSACWQIQLRTSGKLYDNRCLYHAVNTESLVGSYSHAGRRMRVEIGESSHHPSCCLLGGYANCARFYSRLQCRPNSVSWTVPAHCRSDTRHSAELLIQCRLFRLRLLRQRTIQHLPDIQHAVCGTRCDWCAKTGKWPKKALTIMQLISRSYISSRIPTPAILACTWG